MKSQESLIEERKFEIDLCHKHLDTMQKNGISMEGSEAFVHLVLLLKDVNIDNLPSVLIIH